MAPPRPSVTQSIVACRVRSLRSARSMSASPVSAGGTCSARIGMLTAADERLGLIRDAIDVARHDGAGLARARGRANGALLIHIVHVDDAGGCEELGRQLVRLQREALRRGSRARCARPCARRRGSRRTGSTRRARARRPRRCRAGRVPRECGRRSRPSPGCPRTSSAGRARRRWRAPWQSGRRTRSCGSRSESSTGGRLPRAGRAGGTRSRPRSHRFQ